MLSKTRKLCFGMLKCSRMMLELRKLCVLEVYIVFGDWCCNVSLLFHCTLFAPLFAHLVSSVVGGNIFRSIFIFILLRCST